MKDTFAQKATISEEVINFKTYPYSDPDPVAHITKYYPYYRFDGFTNTPKEQGWKIITLENQYIKVLVAPEIGGKVLGAIDKASGEEFIYFNKVVKFRDIAMRGAWTSGGIEFNFGSIGHAPTTASPVNYLLQENTDGSVSCFVGAPDITSRTEWRVEVRLQPDKSYFETKAIWYNPSNLNTSLYNWMTASVDATDDLEYYFPGTIEIGHGGEVSPWPVNEKGIDVSYYKNNNFGGPKSYHVLGEYAEHFLCYFRDKDFGLGHWSAYDEKPGQKIWIWGLSRQGEIWTDLLTDPGNVQYTEIQTGLLFNQAAEKSAETPYKHLFFNAGSEYKFNELWFPVKEIGGMVKADEYGSLNVEHADGKVKIGFCANQNITDELTVLADGKEIVRKNISLKPTEAFVEMYEVTAEDIQVKIGNIFSYSTKERKERALAKPTEISKDFNWDSTDAIFSAGVGMEKQRNYKGAEEKYSRVLEQNPFHTGALSKMAGLLYRKMEHQKADEYALKALSNDTYNPEANYIFGLISLKLDRKYDALDAFSMAARSMEFRSLAYTQISTIFFADGETSKSLKYANEALDYNQNNINALKLKALDFERVGRQQQRNEVLDKILSIDPLNAFARFEKGEDFAKVLNYEMPHEICLEQAIAYFNLGLKEKAVQILQLNTSNPIVNYWLAFLKGDSEYLEKAIQASPNLVYPSRNETAEVLKWALSKNQNWKTNYYLGLIYWSKGLTDKAKEYFIECNDQPDYFAFYLTRFNLLKADADYNGENDLLKAYELNNNEWRCYMSLSNYYESEQKFTDVLSWAEKGFLKFPNNYVLAFQKAKALLINGRYQESLNVLIKTNILPNEGASAGRVTYRQACVMDAIDKLQKNKSKSAISRINQARQWPENLGVGKPYETDERIEDYLESLYWHKKGNVSIANKLENSIVDFSLNTTEFSSGQYLGAVLLKKNDRMKEAQELLAKWKNNQPENLIAQWSYAKLMEENSKAESILKDILKESGVTLFSPQNRDRAFALVVALSELE
ncbi:DUF5107 domain-containing protein [Prolixibacteraceae bacterium Z1-6]|uniref:DUF5107 domain-containing protein n=1 Tax=Draconibacterium aestuarii TaxID=2998507 RepID=A0A9X3F764_9BACT|nr:DUF5107 domain-containing protein [Prolixibacteraceae bacterium Z1-6]